VSDVFQDDLLIVISINSNEDVAMVEDHQVAFIQSPVLSTRLVEKVDLLPMVCLENRYQVEPEDVRFRISIKLTKRIVGDTDKGIRKIHKSG
jgi:hypothetical protein